MDYPIARWDASTGDWKPVLPSIVVMVEKVATSGFTGGKANRKQSNIFGVGMDCSVSKKEDP